MPKKVPIFLILKRFPNELLRGELEGFETTGRFNLLDRRGGRFSLQNLELLLVFD